ncbi:hypothetical protein [Streptomyces sp. ALI-76-A]|uniref:hypothetical protein n=1 Tax=Streptomyces sp. ALI-76-A TaxID=3025736 RepID=UPI00256EAF97|nr:hypothetical protein [Streptomyces sp. ALI-76-A]MDL5205254.1 hypothetical protein [Streptomyces sp. ALI-76-A]
MTFADMASYTSDEVKHMEFIQAVVTRLGNGSFLIKGWTMTVSGVFFGILVNNLSWKLAATGIIPILGFWLLDSYYLRQERLFRALYDEVRVRAAGVAPFSMNVGPYLARVPWGRVVGSRTMVNFYGVLGAVDVAFTVGAVIAAA